VQVACGQVLRFLSGSYPKADEVAVMREIRAPWLATFTTGKWTHRDQVSYLAPVYPYLHVAPI
jgi:hypothetical protein